MKWLIAEPIVTIPKLSQARQQLLLEDLGEHMLGNLSNAIMVLGQIALIMVICVIITFLICLIIYIIGLFRYVMEQEDDDEKNSKGNNKNDN